MAVKTIFRQAKWGLHFAKCFFFFAQKWRRAPTVLRRTQRPRCSVAEQHANTQSFICKADGLVMWYPSTLVMVWVPGILIHGGKAKMEIMNSICCVFLFFSLFPKITFWLTLCIYTVLKNNRHLNYIIKYNICSHILNKWWIWCWNIEASLLGLY